MNDSNGTGAGNNTLGSGSNAEWIIAGSSLGAILMIAIVLIVAALACYKKQGRRCRCCHLFRARQIVALTNSETVTYTRRGRPVNHYYTPSDACTITPTSSVNERSCVVSYADPVDTLLTQPTMSEACTEHRLYVTPKYTDPQSLDSGATYTTGYSSVFQMSGMYVPTLKERSAIIDGHYEGQHNFKHQYSKLSFFKESKVYWAPATTASGLYAQLSANRYREIPRQQLRLLEQIGSGFSANICKGLWVCEGESMFVAVKTLKKKCVQESSPIRFLQEAAIMGQFWHPNVIALHGVVTVGTPFHIVLEYASNGDLLKYLKNTRITNRERDNPAELQKEFLRFATEVASGMMYLARKKYVHRDLAARNVLLDAHMNCKIADFGLTKHLTENGYYDCREGQVPVKWTAPEALLHKRYSRASDVWSFGIVLYEMWALGLPPFKNKSVEEIMKIHGGSPGYCLPPPPGTPRLVYNLMVQCWHPVPKERVTFQYLYQSLCQPEDYLLSWSDDIPDSARQLGADHTHSENLHSDLQTKYR